MKRSIIPIFTITTVFCFLAGEQDRPAFARTIHANAGRSSIGSIADRFDSSISTTAIVNNDTTSWTWEIPIVFENPGGAARTITVRGKVSSAGFMNCGAGALSTSGALVALSGAVAFPANGVYTSIPLTLATVPAGAVGVVQCNIGPNKFAELSGIDYTP